MPKHKLVGMQLILIGMIFSPPALAVDLADYTVKDLLDPCIEGDNDSRWGTDAETECEQYVTGFTDAYVIFSQAGKQEGVCLPDPDIRADEVRWAFMRWAHKNYELRGMPAAKGLHQAIKSSFPCKKK